MAVRDERIVGHIALNAETSRPVMALVAKLAAERPALFVARLLVDPEPAAKAWDGTSSNRHGALRSRAATARCSTSSKHRRRSLQSRSTAGMDRRRSDGCLSADLVRRLTNSSPWSSALTTAPSAGGMGQCLTADRLGVGTVGRAHRRRSGCSGVERANESDMRPRHARPVVLRLPAAGSYPEPPAVGSTTVGHWLGARVPSLHATQQSA